MYPLWSELNLTPSSTELVSFAPFRFVGPDVALKDPQQLYLDWERAHWAAQDIDLAADRGDWEGLEDGERGLLSYALSSLMVAEERISTQFCGLVLAQDDEEEGSYLSTQLVDEVRHMQFYALYQDEVIADPAAIAVHVARATPRYNLTLMAGMPVRLHGTVVRFAIDRGTRFSGPPGSSVWPIGGATSGTVGDSTT